MHHEPTTMSDPRPSEPAARSRRHFLGAGGASVAALAVAGLPASATPASPSSPTPPAPTADHEAARRQALQARIAAAQACHDQPLRPQPVNGDEARYDSFIGSDTRGLPHDARGEVDRPAYRLALAAYASGDPRDFEKIPLGGPRKQLNPLGSLAVSLTGLVPAQFSIPPAPALASAQRAAEAVELYWQSLLRDVPFSEFRDDTTHPLVLAAVAELDRLQDYPGARAAGRVTPSSLFRGTAWAVDRSDPSGRRGRWLTPPGALEGPYLSQFLLKDAAFGTQRLSARIQALRPGVDFHTDPAEWLAIQNGQLPVRKPELDPTPRYITTGRDLAEYVHNNPAAFTVAAALLSTPAEQGGIGAPLNPGNPYLRSKTQTGGSSTFAPPYLAGLLPLATSRVIRATYWQKFYVHRTLRPEAYGGLVHQRLANGVADYPIHAQLLESQALARAKARFGTHLLAHVYPEGAPIHASYPGGATAIAAANVTLLKAFHDERHVIPNPVQVDPRDPTRLIPYEGPPLTVGGELNKLALNYGLGRNWAGIHWRSDFGASLPLAEEVAIALLRDERPTFREAFEGFRFTRFDGSPIAV